jgi:hypothetical protein
MFFNLTGDPFPIKDEYVYQEYYPIPLNPEQNTACQFDNPVPIDSNITLKINTSVNEYSFIPFYSCQNLDIKILSATAKNSTIDNSISFSESQVIINTSELQANTTYEILVKAQYDIELYTLWSENSFHILTINQNPYLTNFASEYLIHFNLLGTINLSIHDDENDEILFELISLNEINCSNIGLNKCPIRKGRNYNI